MRRILLKGINNDSGDTFLTLLRNSYLKINLVFASGLLLVFAYFAIFSPDLNNYPVVCIHERISGEPCFSCGLSHSISLVLRGRISESFEWNIYGPRVFIFFFSSLIMRVVFTLIYLRNKLIRKQVIYYDIACSVLLFFITFYPFLENHLRLLIN